MKLIFIVVLNWNREADTIGCLESIEKLKKDGCRLTTVVVDNASKKESLQAIRRFIEGKKKIHLLSNKENIGYTGGNNVGIKYALEKGADWVMVLNNDTVLDKNIINEFYKASQKNPKAGILSPKIYFAKGFEFHKKRYEKSVLGKVVWYAGGKVDWNNVCATNSGVDEVDKGQFAKEREIDFATGTCMFISSSVLKKVGMFNEKYFMYLEDVDFSQKVKHAGFKILFIPKAILWHKVAQSSGAGSYLNDYFITRNRMLFGFSYAKLRTRLALIRESLKLLAIGRKWQKLGIISFYFGSFGKGFWKTEN